MMSLSSLEIEVYIVCLIFKNQFSQLIFAIKAVSFIFIA